MLEVHLITLWPWPSDLRVNVCLEPVMHYTSTKFCIDRSSCLPSIHRHTDKLKLITRPTWQLLPVCENQAFTSTQLCHKFVVSYNRWPHIHSKLPLPLGGVIWTYLTHHSKWHLYRLSHSSKIYMHTNWQTDWLTDRWHTELDYENRPFTL